MEKMIRGASRGSTSAICGKFEREREREREREGKKRVFGDHFPLSFGSFGHQ